MSGAIRIFRERFERIEREAIAELRDAGKLGDAPLHPALEIAAEAIERMPGSTSEKKKVKSRLHRYLMTALAARRVVDGLDEIEAAELDAEQVATVCRLVDAAFFAGHHQLRHAAAIGYAQQLNGAKAREQVAFGAGKKHQHWIAESIRLRDKGVASRRARARQIGAATGAKVETILSILKAHGV